MRWLHIKELDFDLNDPKLSSVFSDQDKNIKYEHASRGIKAAEEVPKIKKNLKKRYYEFLILFATSRPLSVYQIYRNYKSIHKMKYKKGVKEIVKKLLDLILIEVVENKISKHEAIDYRLSTGGLYYLVYNKRREFIGLFNIVLQHYCQNIIFTTLLYPYLQKSSLINIRDTSLISKICAYLHECCEEIGNALGSIEKSRSKYMVQQICLWNDVHERGGNNYRLIDFLKPEFNLNWLDNRVEVTKYGNDSTVSISKGNNRILITLNEGRTEAIMTMNRKELYKFTVSPMLEILYKGQTIQERSIFFFLKRVESLAADLVIALALRAIIELDIKALSQDEKFMRVLEENKKKFDERYLKLVEFVPSS